MVNWSLCCRVKSQGGSLRPGNMKMALDARWVPNILLLLAVFLQFLGAREMAQQL